MSGVRVGGTNALIKRCLACEHNATAIEHAWSSASSAPRSSPSRHGRCVEHLYDKLKEIAAIFTG